MRIKKLGLVQAQMMAVALLVFGWVAAAAAGYNPWRWILLAAFGWGMGIMIACSLACARMRWEEKRWNEELHRLMDFNRMLAEERRERKAQAR